MIDISLKALRFARLVAEEQRVFAGDPLIVAIRREEEIFTRVAGRVGPALDISEAMAAFCLRAVTAFLAQPDRFHTSEWDGNDFVFLQGVARSLREQLTALRAQAV